MRYHINYIYYYKLELICFPSLIVALKKMIFLGEVILYVIKFFGLSQCTHQYGKIKSMLYHKLTSAFSV